MSSGKAILIKRLSSLLGFQDGASDVLEHLLTIESSPDLLDYLSQLLGTDNEKVQSFVSAIGMFQRGESPVAEDDDNENDGFDQQQQQQLDKPMPKPAVAATTTTAKPNPPPATKKATSVPASSKKAPQANPQPKSQQQNNQSSIRPSGGGGNNTNSNLVSLKKMSSHTTNSTTNTNTNNNTNNQGKSSSNPPPPPPSSQATPALVAPVPTATATVPPAPRPLPKKGTAKVECGCFGYLHKPLTNCLFCGRVSCEREGYDFCNFCGYQVLPPPAPGSNGVVQHDAAWIHKEKLLRYDRESAQRTIVLDDQADYFSNASERFMSQQERDEAREKEDERTRKTHQRQNMQLNLAL